MAWIEHEEVGTRPTSVISSNPRAMQAVRDLNQYLSFGTSALTRVQEEAIATTVAALNKCRF